MQNDFVKETKIVELNEIEKNEELIKSINFVKNSLNNMYNNMQFAENELVDYYTYQIKAQESKYNYLIKQAKNRNLEI